MPQAATIATLRSLVAAWTPVPQARSRESVATGVRAIDAALGGGLPRGQVTELVAEAPGGGDLALGALLASTRAARLRLALIDAADGFAPRSHPEDLLRHLVWVRPRSLTEAVACADVLVRDGNYAVTILDVRGVAPRLLRRQPASVWHRLRLAAEQNPAAVLVCSSSGFFPAVPWRVALRTPAALSTLRRTRKERTEALAVAVERGHADIMERAG